MKSYDRFKIKKPHTKHIEEIIKNDITTIRSIASGLYLSKKSKHECHPYFGIKTTKKNTWTLYKKTPIKKKLEGSKYDWFGL